MKNIHELYKEAYIEVIAAGIQPGNVAAVSVNRRLKKRLGQCRTQPGADGRPIFKIELAASLLGDDIADEKTKQVLIHEILHTCRGCMNHGAAWKANAAKINRKYPQYHIARTTSFEELGIDGGAEARYAVRCEACGKVFGRMKRSPLILHPERYRCRCGGRLVRTK